FSSRRRHTRFDCDWSSDVCSSDLPQASDIHFHQLHATCHRRVHYEKVCPVHGRVTNDEIVSGYEYRKGQYVEIEPAELDALRTRSEERRVGKECRCRGPQEQAKRK